MPAQYVRGIASSLTGHWAESGNSARQNFKGGVVELLVGTSVLVVYIFEISQEVFRRL